MVRWFHGHGRYRTRSKYILANRFFWLLLLFKFQGGGPFRSLRWNYAYRIYVCSARHLLVGCFWVLPFLILCFAPAIPKADKLGLKLTISKSKDDQTPQTELLQKDKTEPKTGRPPKHQTQCSPLGPAGRVQEALEPSNVVPTCLFAMKDCEDTYVQASRVWSAG